MTLRISRISGCVLMATPFLALAQTNPPPQAASNEQVLQNWQQNNVGGQQPVLVKQGEGETRIEWKGSVTANAYSNDIVNANGVTNTPLTSGSFYKSVVTSDMRAVLPGGNVNYFQFGVTHSNDRSVLSLFPRQINNIQLGSSGQNYMLAVGDVAPNFSSLSSSLGVRGLIGQYKLGDATAYGYAGVVAESWEALEKNVLRNQFVRDVVGAKVEYALTPSLKVYATGQRAGDQDGSITNVDIAASALPSQIHSSTIGFQYAEGAYQLSGETALSSFRQSGQEGRSGQASILDSTWRGQSLSLRGGYHDIDPKFVTLSGMASPGVREVYAGGDWTAATWVTLGAELRNSKNISLATTDVPSTTTTTDSGTLRANINFGPDMPGWGLSLQDMESRITDPQRQISKNAQRSATLNYSAQGWTTGFGYGLATVRSQASPTWDSDTASWNLNVGRVFSDADGASPATWSLNLGLVAALQYQHMLYGSDTQNINYTLNLSGQRNGWGNFALQLVDGFITRPGASDLRSRAAQFEATHPFSSQNALKFYYRKAFRNIHDPLSGATERVSGIQYNHAF